MTGSLRLLSISLFATVLAAALAVPAQAQSPTAVTSIVNSNADTTLEVNYSGGLLMTGKFTNPDNYSAPNDSIPAEGAGTRLMWYPEKATFRAGATSGTDWDASNVGDFSVAFGVNTKASSQAATAMGQGTTASDRSATAMGSGTTASAEEATAMGFFTTASGKRATAMGYLTEAASFQSLTVGQCNSANRSGDLTRLVVGNGTFSSGSCESRSDALRLKRNGDLAVGHSSPTSRLHVKGNVSGSAADPSAHVGYIENTGGAGSDGLAIKAGPNDAPGNPVNYLTFYDGDGDAIGAIEGASASGTGINLNTSSGDFAEELPVAKGTEAPAPAEIVGVEGGEVSLSTDGVDRVMIASRAPILTGNATPATTADDDRRVAVAFVGQVPVKLQGLAEPGDLIVPSGKDDGTARAVSPSEYRRATHGPIAGQAWSAKETSEVGEITVAVGLGRSGAVAEQLTSQRERIAELETENEEFEDRLTALEAERSPSAVAGLTGSTAGVLLAFVLGGLAGAGLLWRRRR